MHILARILTTILSLLIFSNVNGQTKGADISRYFNDYEIVTFDTKRLLNTSKKSSNDFFIYEFKLSEKYSWKLNLAQDHLFADNFILREGNNPAKSKNEIDNLPVILKGLDSSNNEIEATITVNNNFLYGLIETRSTKIYFEPLSSFDENAKEDEFIVYDLKDVIPVEGQFCAATEQQKKSDNIDFESVNQSGSRNGECIGVDYAVANDHWVYDSRGSGTSNWNAGLVANMNTDYDDTFNDEIRFEIVEIYVSQNVQQDAWGNSTDLLEVLNNFTSWAPNGFQNAHDLGGIWSDYNYSGSTIGWASIGAVCSSYRYHSLKDYGGSAAGYQNLYSHEVGHNFNCGHDSSSGFVMSGTVSNSGNTTWSAASKTSVNNYYPNRSCLEGCGSGPPQGDAPVANFGAVMLQECNPTQVQMQDLSTNFPTSWLWTFQNGSPGSSQAKNPVVNFPGGGDYRVTLTATNASGSDTKILNMTLNVTPAPTAGFTFNKSGNTVNFTNSSSGATSYSWNFGDGSNSTSTNPTHNYSASGNYSVTLTATNECGTDTEVKTVNIEDQITAAFTANPSTTCEGETIQFTNQSVGNITSYSWEFEGGTPATSSSASPVVRYNNSGLFNAKLTVQNATSSDVENKINYINISGDPTSSFDYSKNGYVVNFDNNSIGGTSYFWSFGDGTTSTSTNPNHTYEPGTFTVTLTTTSECGTDVSIETINIEEQVSASFESSPKSGCEGFSVEYFSTSTGEITSYLWEFEGGSPSTSTNANPTVIYNNSGTFNAKLTVSNSSSSDVENKINYVNTISAPNATFTYSSNSYTFFFDNNTVGGTAYQWNFGDGNTSSAANPDHTYATPGEYQVVLSAENECGSTEYSKQVSIEEVISASYEVSKTSACEGDVIQFYNTSFGDLASLSWEFEGGNPSTSSSQNPVVQYNSSGIYNVKLTIQGIYGKVDILETTNLIDVSKYAISDFSYVLDEFTVSFNNLSENVTNVTWEFGDGTTSQSFSPVHTYAQEGDYVIKLIAFNECGTDIKEVTIPVYDQLLANFQASKTTLCPGETVVLQDLSSGNPTQWMWNIEGSSMITAEEQNPTLNLMEAGNYNVKLTVSNLEEQNSKVINQYIHVMELPESDFSYVQTELDVVFENNSSHSNEYFWDFGDGTTSTLSSPIHNYSEEGVYMVSLQVGNECNNEVMEKEIPVYKKLVAGFYTNTTQTCTNKNVEFFDSSSGSAKTWEWHFPGGTPSISNDKNPKVAYTNPGTYDVSLFVSSETEQIELVKSVYLEVLETPEVAIISEINNYGINLSSTEVGANEFYWDFGDGSSSNDKNPNHEYSNEGEYAVKLIISNICGLDTVVKNVKIEVPIEIAFASNTTEVCPQSVVNFLSDNSKNVLSWEWNFPGGTPSSSTQKNPQIKYTTPGNYPVQLKVKSLFNEKEISYDQMINVFDIPKANFEFEVNKDSVRFFNISKESTTFKWLINGIEASNELSPILIFDEEKAYDITLIATNNCSSDTILKTVDLYNSASAYANFSIEQPLYCLGETIKFIDLSSDDITTWQWSFPGASPSESNEKNPSVMYMDYGKYDVQLTVSNGFNTRTLNLKDYVNIDQKPVALFETELMGNKVQLTNNSESANKFLWKFGDGKTANTKNAIHEYHKNGKYNISLKVENSCGISELSTEVNIDVFPQAGFSLDNTQGCSPLNVNFENRSSFNASQIKWILKGNENSTFEVENPSVEFTTPGIYGIMIIASNEYGVDTVSLNNLIEVYESPEVSFTYEQVGKNYEFYAQISNFDSIRWEFSDNFSSDELNPMHQFEEYDIFTVKLTAYLGDCENEFVDTITNLSTSVLDLDEVNRATIYPNPASNNITIELEEIESIQSIELIDQLGRRIMNQKINSSFDKINLNLPHNITSGQYFLFIIKDNGTPLINKLVISK